MLWESETRRVVAEPATLYSAFEDDDLFLAASHHAGQLGVRLWADNSQRQFAIKRLGECMLDSTAAWLGVGLGHAAASEASSMRCVLNCCSGRRGSVCIT